jgi:hypothetical protein
MGMRMGSTGASSCSIVIVAMGDMVILLTGKRKRVGQWDGEISQARLLW